MIFEEFAKSHPYAATHVEGPSLFHRKASAWLRFLGYSLWESETNPTYGYGFMEYALDSAHPMVSVHYHPDYPFLLLAEHFLRTASDATSRDRETIIREINTMPE